MSVKDSIYGALPPDAQVVRAYKNGELADLISGALERAGTGFDDASTVLVHYLFSILGIPSQRKVEEGETVLDVVVPDLPTLRRDPRAALVVCILESPEQAGQRAREVSRLQPDIDLIWMVCGSAVSGYRTFVSAAGLAELPRAAEDFLTRAGSGRLRVLGSRS